MDPFTQLLIAAAITAVTTGINHLTRKTPKNIFSQPAEFEETSRSVASHDRACPVHWGTNKIQSLIELYSGDNNSYSIIGNLNSENYVAAHRYLKTITYLIGIGEYDEITKVWMTEKPIWAGDFGRVTRSGSLGAKRTINPGQRRLREETPAGFINKPRLFGELNEQGGVYGRVSWRNGSPANQIQHDINYADIQRVYSQETGISTSIIDNYIGGYKNCSTITFTGDVSYTGFQDTNFTWGFDMNSAPYMRQVAVEVRRIPNPLGLRDGGAVIQRYRVPNPNDNTRQITYTHMDCNPATIIYDVLHSHLYGLNIPDSRIDVDSFKKVGEMLRTERMGLSIILKEFVEAGRFIRQITDRFELRLIYDRELQKYILIPIRPDNVRDIPVLDSSDFDTLEYSWNNLDFNPTRVKVVYKDPARNYTKQTVKQDNQAVFRTRGSRIKTTTIIDEGISAPHVAARVGTRAENAGNIPLLLAKGTLPPDKIIDSKPGDKVYINFRHTQDQIQRAKMIIASINRGRTTDNRYIVNLVQDEASTNDTVFVQIPKEVSDVPVITIPPIETQMVRELPWFMTNKLILTASTNGSDPEHTYLQYIASINNPDVLSFDTLAENKTGITDPGDFFIPDISELRLTPTGVITSVTNLNNMLRFSSDYSTRSITVTNIINPGPLIRTAYSSFAQRDGQALMQIGNELFTYERITFQNRNTAIVSGINRAILDTVRGADIVNDDRVWFLYPVNSPETSRINYEGTESLRFKFLSRTSFGILDSSAAPDLSYTLTSRPRRPMPLLRLDIDGSNRPVIVSSKRTYSVVPQVKPRDRIAFERDGVSPTPNTGDRTRYITYVNNAQVNTKIQLDSAGLSTTITVPVVPASGSTIRFEAERWQGDPNVSTSLKNHQTYEISVTTR